jgi:hypothetical protein
MNSNFPRDWRAQIPSADFAERTALAILRERSARRSEWRPGRRLAMVAAAAIFVAGGAWGWTTLPKSVVPRAEHRILPPSPAPCVVTPPPAVRAPIEPPTDPPRKSPASAPPLPRRKEVPPASSAALPDAGRRIIVPRCSCQEAICDCLEEH